MRRFRFRLASLLRLRAQLERASRRELAVVMGELATIDQQLAAAAQGLRECADQGARPDAIGQLAKAFENGLRRHHWRLTRLLQAAQQRLDGARADYAQKAKDLRAMQQLRDQERAAWRLAVQRAEQADLDELAATARAAAQASRAALAEEAR